MLYLILAYLLAVSFTCSLLSYLDNDYKTGYVLDNVSLSCALLATIIVIIITIGTA